MKHTTTKSVDHVIAPIMSEFELAHLGGGEVAYIKTLTSDEATTMFPQIQGLPKGIPLFSLHAADGTPIALTDTLQAAIGHAQEDELAIAPLH
ncbi:DUF1150 domain-containing protein [Hyphomicrobium methylovorum]|uniref:BQ00720 family protein n=1 Tax=Hyphomicrobium methylovorum TaxID=84 RepID=UPI001FE45E78|nr:DUF1150 domain-containing protein [Hyphomicrobium methylovorum]MBA2125595.1 DUF1150 domain-containing protein [Hyphomicrobium methylovorum]